MKRDMVVTSRDTSENMFEGDKLFQQRTHRPPYSCAVCKGTQNYHP